MLNDDTAVIESLYPPDSEYSDTNTIGQRLLLEAIAEYGWRNLPKEILATYARLCEQRERAQDYEVMRKHRNSY